MKKAGLLLPPAFLLLGLALGRYFPWAGRPGDSPAPSLPSGPLPAAAAPASAPPASRPTQPVLADWWDFLRTLEHATLTDLPAIWKALPLPDGKSPDSPGSSARHQMVIERWTELDPAGALTFVKETGQNDEGLFVVIFQTWAQFDPETALAALQAQTEPKIQNNGIAGFLLSFKEHPAKLIQWAKRCTWVDAAKLDQRTFTAACPDDLLRRLLDADRSGLYEVAPHLPPWFLQRLESLTLIQQATTNLPAVLASLQSRRLTKEEACSMAEQLDALAKTTPASALAIVEALHAASGGTPFIDGNSSYPFASTLLKYLAVKEPEASVAFLKKHLGSAAKINIGSSAYDEIFATNPAAALVIGSAITIFPIEMSQLPTFKDRQTALEILPAAPPSWRRDKALKNTLERWQRESPDEALTWLKSLPEGAWRDRAAIILEAPGTHANVTALKLQAQTLREYSDRTEFVLDDVRKIAGQAAQSDLAETMQTLGEWPPGPARETALAEAAKTAAGQSTTKALTYIQNLTDPNAQADGIRGVLAIWTANEPGAASEWLPGLAPGPVREAAVDSFAETIASLDPAASLAWAATLADPVARSTRLETTYRKWATENPVEASAALAEIPGLTAADLQQFRTPPLPPTK